MKRFNTFIGNMKSKAKEKIGAIQTTEIIILILVVIVIIGVLVLPSLKAMLTKGFEATDKKMDQIIEYVG